MSTQPHINTGKRPSKATSSPSLAIHSGGETFQCMWDGDAPGVHCNELFCGHELSAHLKDHGLEGTEKSRFSCKWNSCGVELNRGNVLRHVKEKHLVINYACDICNQTFTRRYNMLTHCKKCHRSA